MPSLVPTILLITAALLFSAPGATQPRTDSAGTTSVATSSAVLRVGPTREIRTLRSAAELARDGSIIEVDAGDYTGDVAVWTQSKLTIRGIGERPRLIANGVAAESKGTFVIRGGDVTVENIAFSGARVPDRNGAGIRLEKGRLTVVRCHFEGNENGILTANDPTVELDVVDSTFLNNGAGDGMTHHVYAGAILKLHVRGSYFGPARKGHLLKSRAMTTEVLYNRLTGESGTSSYEIDIPNAGNFRAVGNLVQQGSQTENNTLISYGAEGYRWPQNRVLLMFNTLINDRPQGGVFISIRPGAAQVAISNNILVGRGDFDIRTPAETKNNVPARAEDFVDAAQFDYRIRVSNRLVGTAGMASAYNTDEKPSGEYRHPAGTVDLVGFTPLTPLSPGAFQRLAR